MDGTRIHTNFVSTTAEIFSIISLMYLDASVIPTIILLLLSVARTAGVLDLFIRKRLLLNPKNFNVMAGGTPNVDEKLTVICR